MSSTWKTNGYTLRWIIRWYVFLLALQTAQEKKCTSLRGDNLSHKTGVDINTSLTIDEITFQKKNTTCNTISRLTTYYTNTLGQHIVFRVYKTVILLHMHIYIHEYTNYFCNLFKATSIRV